MTQVADVTGSAARTGETRAIALVCGAHFVSHFYILLLPPFFVFIRADYGVTYTELGLALTIFNITTGACQTPAGFLVDRIGARNVLVAGLVLFALAVAVAGLVPSYWVLVAMFAIMGVANGVYHPADYAILSQAVSPRRAGQAFSLHIFAGFIGTAIAPGTLLILERYLSWRGAWLASAMLALLVAAPLMAAPAALFAPASSSPRKPAAGMKRDADHGWRLLLSPPILLNLMFFVMIAIIGGGIQNYSVVALGELFGTPLSTANVALSAYLFLSAAGVLVGGVLASRTSRHELVAAIGLLSGAVTAGLLGFVDLGTGLLIAMMSLSGFVTGLYMPSRDMIVRAVTPEGAFGKVFGFVTTGFNIGGIMSPLLFGWFMDSGHPAAIFTIVVIASLVGILTILPSFIRRRAR